MAELAFHKFVSVVSISALRSRRLISCRLAPNPCDAADVIGSSSRPNICLVVFSSDVLNDLDCTELTDARSIAKDDDTRRVVLIICLTNFYGHYTVHQGRV